MDATVNSVGFGSTIRAQLQTRRQHVSVVDALAMIVGIVVGSGIFKAPSLVAANAGSELVFLLLWPLGGAISLLGALCYAELASTYPSEGGDYHYFTLSFGPGVAFLFAWARLLVIQTGSIAILAFVFGDYFAQLVPLGQQAAAIYAAGSVVALTVINCLSLKQTKRTQNLLSAAKILGLLAIFVVGIFFSSSPAEITQGTAPFERNAGLAMVFVLLTFGGWNEIAFASAEFRNVQRDMVRALVWGVVLITIVFVAVNASYLKALGLAELAKSEVVASDMVRKAFGDTGAKLISFVIAVCTLGAASGTIFTGARTNYALGKQFEPLSFMAKWHTRADSPVGALLIQGAISLGLVLLGAWQRRGFETLVEYMAPVFWFFFLLTGVSLFRLRRKDAKRIRPFRVPLYPLVPLLFCVASAYMLWSSLSHTGGGSVVGVVVLLAGLLVLRITKRAEPKGVLH